jgi:hypothetical protein
MPYRVWAAHYTAVHSAIEASRPGADRAALNHQARELVLEIRPDWAKPTMTPGVR